MFTENEDLERQFGDAAYAYCGGEFEEAFAGFSKLAEIGHLKATAYLAELYLRGEGVPQDLDHGIQLLVRAANLGSSQAAYNLGALYRAGHYGIIKDDYTSKRFFRLAKELGCELPVDQYLN